MKPILVVDDEAIVRESIRDWLEDAGYQVAVMLAIMAGLGIGPLGG